MSKFKKIMAIILAVVMVGSLLLSTLMMLVFYAA